VAECLVELVSKPVAQAFKPALGKAAFDFAQARAFDFAPFGYAQGRQARKASHYRRWRSVNSSQLRG
jgi:hypothetical protein